MRVVEMACGSSHDGDSGCEHHDSLFLAACVECSTRHTSMETAYVVL